MTMRMVRNLRIGLARVWLQKMVEQHTSTLRVNVITPGPDEFMTFLYLSVLPSFLSRLPPSIHTLRITFILSRLFGDQDLSSKLSYLTLDCLEDLVEKDGVANLAMTFNRQGVFIKIKGVKSSVDSSDNSDVATCVDALLDSGVDSVIHPNADPCITFIRSFPILPGNAIFTGIAFYSRDDRCFVPIRDDKSPSSLLENIVSIIQLSVSAPGGIPSSISCLPAELLSMIFGFMTSSDSAVLSKVCKLWRVISVPDWGLPTSAREAYARLKHCPGAGRQWDQLWLKESISLATAEKLIMGSPNVTYVVIHAFWSEEEAKLLLNAIQGLKKVDGVIFGEKGLRKWGKEEVENFMQMMGGRIRLFEASTVEDSPSSVLSAGLPLPPDLQSLSLYKYPPLRSLFLPHNLERLTLSNLCPLPPSFLEHPLPPLLHKLNITLGPFSPGGETSILRTPLNLSHLPMLTYLDLDGGEETSNLVPRRFFSTLKNAIAIRRVNLAYCGVDSIDFQDFIHWFFGDWRVRGAKEEDWPDADERRLILIVLLFFGQWHEEVIKTAKRVMEECVVDRQIIARVED
ncbi:hypothetical protein BT69DRAFT_1354644 [Atractiella rhizophila]|nr:hypothetical protein BT69DRAFT_1354644 [Atractiella rhizophila]